MKLNEECGVTQFSLHNAEKLIARYGKPYKIVLKTDPEEWYTVTAHWRDHNVDVAFVFTGFSWGYAGEGPHGLNKFFEMCDVVCGMQAIINMPQKDFELVI